MDSITIQREIQFNIEQLDEIVVFLGGEHGEGDMRGGDMGKGHEGGGHGEGDMRGGEHGLRDVIIPEPSATLRIKTIMFMWYFKNGFRELAATFNSAASWCDTLIVRSSDAYEERLLCSDLKSLKMI